MAIGDDAAASGMLVVPDTGENGKVKWGGREINRTRDYIAQRTAGQPTNVTAWRNLARISYGTADPSGGNNGDIYLKILT